MFALLALLMAVIIAVLLNGARLLWLASGNISNEFQLEEISAPTLKSSSPKQGILELDPHNNQLNLMTNLPCSEFIDDAQFMKILVLNAEKLSAKALIGLLECGLKQPHRQRVINRFCQWEALKTTEAPIYNAVLEQLKLEDLSSNSLSAFPGDDLIAKWPHKSIEKVEFCSKFTNPQNLFSALKNGQGNWPEVIRRPCVHGLMKACPSQSLEFLLEWIPKSGFVRKGDRFKWVLLMEHVLVGSLIKGFDSKPIEYTKAISIVKAFSKNGVDFIIDASLKQAVKQVLIYGHKCTSGDDKIASSLVSDPDRDLDSANPFKPFEGIDRLELHIKALYDWSILLKPLADSQVLAIENELDREQQLDLEFSIFGDEVLQIKLFTEAPDTIEQSTFDQWFNVAVQLEHFNLVRFLAEKYAKTMQFQVWPPPKGKLENCLIELKNHPKAGINFLLNTFFFAARVTVPFLPAESRIEVLSAAEKICLEAGSLEKLNESAINESFKKQCAARFDELLASAKDKKEKNELIVQFVEAAFNSLERLSMTKKYSISIEFADKETEDLGGLSRHFVSLMLGLLADEHFGCLLPVTDSGSLCFTPFLDPKWAGILGFLQAQALICGTSPGFTLDFRLHMHYLPKSEDELPTNRFPRLQWLLNNLNCPLKKKFTFGQAISEEAIETSLTAEYFAELKRFSHRILKECNQQYVKNLCGCFNLSHSPAIQDALQSFLEFSVNERPNLEDFMRVLHFETETAPWIEGRSFEEVFTEICEELDSEWEEFIPAFLLFSRGSSGVPATLISSLQIRIIAKLEEECEELKFPTASTCEESIRFNVPFNCTKEALKQRLKYALEHGKDFDFI